MKKNNKTNLSTFIIFILNSFFDQKKKITKGTWRSTPVAIKQILSEKMNEKQIKDFIAEISLMQSLRPHG